MKDCFSFVILIAMSDLPPTNNNNPSNQSVSDFPEVVGWKFSFGAKELILCRLLEMGMQIQAERQQRNLKYMTVGIF